MPTINPVSIHAGLNVIVGWSEELENNFIELYETGSINFSRDLHAPFGESGYKQQEFNLKALAKMTGHHPIHTGLDFNDILEGAEHQVIFNTGISTQAGYILMTDEQFESLTFDVGTKIWYISHLDRPIAYSSPGVSTQDFLPNIHQGGLFTFHITEGARQFTIIEEPANKFDKDVTIGYLSDGVALTVPKDLYKPLI